MTTQQTNQATPLFELEKTVATPGAMVVLSDLNISPIALLSCHHRGNWGDLCAEDKAANDEALINGSRIFSAYQFDTVKIWVITEADRSSTTILLPEEY